MRDDDFHRLLQHCVRCGSCKVICPTYEIQGEEPQSARGRIAILSAVLSGDLQPSHGALEKVLSCIQCGACAKSCPSGIDIPELMYAGRRHLRRYNKKDILIRGTARYALRHPDFTFWLAKTFRSPLLNYLKKRGVVSESFTLPQYTLKDTLQVVKTANTKGRVAVFKGCSVKYIFPDLGKTLVRVLVQLGYEVILPKVEVCCGVPFRSLGMEREAREFARRNIEIFSKIKADAVLSLCPTCIVSLKNEYPRMIKKGIENAMDLSSFLVRYEGLAFRNSLDVKGYYHDPCHMIYGLDVQQEPREILRQCGVSVMNTLNHGCCGFGGVYSYKFSKVSQKIAQERAREINGAGASVVFTSCTGCMLQLRKVVDFEKVFHIVEAVDEALG